MPFTYIACRDCKKYRWLDKCSIPERWARLNDFLKYFHLEHSCVMFDEAHTGNYDEIVGKWEEVDE